jgi:hypothetical protein
MSNTDGFGYMLWPNGASEFDRVAFHNERDLAQLRGLMPVKVVKVYKIDGKTAKTQGDVEEAGFVDVQPLVSQADGNNQKMDHGTIYHIPYTRAYGGNAAVIMDPTVGDVGFVKVADRDISSFKDGYAQGNTGPFTPNSRRRHDFADSVYMGGILSKKPKQYVTFKKDGSIVIGDAAGSTVIMDGKGGITLAPANGIVTIKGQVQATGNVTAGFGGGDSVELQQHTHTLSGGSGTGGPPTPGS